MRLRCARPRKGRLLPVALRVSLLAMIAGLSAACSVTAPAASTVPAASTAPAATPTAPATPDGFTVGGTHPVPANGSQDTRAAAPAASCDSATFNADESVGTEVADGFAVAGFPVAASLLRHFLSGTGTEVDYGTGSPISAEALASSGFKSVNAAVQAEMARLLTAGGTRIELSAGQLPTVAFESKASDLYWGFRGTQGLTVTGHGRRENGRYAGTLTYVIQDSYGFPAGDTLDGFGAPMRYLQTVCGAPPHAGGAHWFRDTIALTLPFNLATARA